MFPTKEELQNLSTTPSSVDDVLQPPQVATDDVPDDVLLPPLIENTHLKRNESKVTSEVNPPSKFYQPPKFLPDFQTEVDSAAPDVPVEEIHTKGVIGSDMFKSLRKIFAVPDYDFPLDTASRPNYGDGPNSFQVKESSVTQRRKT